MKFKLEQHCFGSIREIKKISIEKKDYILLLSPSCLSILDYDSKMNRFFAVEKYNFEKKELRTSIGESMSISPTQKFISISAFQDTIQFFELSNLKLKEITNYKAKGVIWDTKFFSDQEKVFFGLLTSR